jgi:hypothetical protein
VVEEQAARAVRDGRGVEDDVGGAAGRREHQELLGHRQERAVREHGALGMAGGPRGVEEPGHRVGLDGDVRRILARRPTDQRLEVVIAARALAQADEVLDGAQTIAHESQVIAELLGVDQHAGAGVVEHVGVLVRK